MDGPSGALACHEVSAAREDLGSADGAVKDKPVEATVRPQPMSVNMSGTGSPVQKGSEGWIEASPADRVAASNAALDDDVEALASDANFTAEEGRSPNAAQAAALLVKSMADGSDWEQPALTGAPTKQATMDSTGQSAFGPADRLPASNAALDVDAAALASPAGRVAASNAALDDDAEALARHGVNAAAMEDGAITGAGVQGQAP